MRSTWLSLLAALGLILALGATGCGEDCPTGEVICNGNCVNTTTDNNNCGGCGTVCGAMQTCQNGVCSCPGGQMACGPDCVSGVEICNNQDDDCDGQVDESVPPQPCDNACGPGTQTCANGTWSECSAPQPTEEVCDNQDNDCDGETDEGVTTPFYRDSDNDRYGNVGEVREACAAPAGFVEDHTDCDDTNAEVNPGAAEVADTIDNNCDGDIDEGFECIVGAELQCGEGGDVGLCTFGTQRCIDEGDGPTWGSCESGVRPTEEVCDGEDNDCDGEVDDGMSGDSYEANNSCEASRGPLVVNEGEEDSVPGDPLMIEGSLYSADEGTQDEDWFLVQARESSDWPWAEPNCYYLNAVFMPPEGTDIADWEFCMVHHEDDECSGDIYESFCTSAEDLIEGEDAYGIEIYWAPGFFPWGFDNGRTLYFSVQPAGGATINDCREYQLAITLAATPEDCPEE